VYDSSIFKIFDQIMLKVNVYQILQSDTIDKRNPFTFVFKRN